MTTRYYCTHFDRNYLIKAVAMLESLHACEHCAYEVFAICHDETSSDLIRKLQLSNVTIVDVRAIEDNDSELAVVKKRRTMLEYYWTLVPTMLLWILEQRETVDILTLIDADIFLFSSLEPVYEEMREQSVLIQEHRYPATWPHYKMLHFNQYGRYNSGFMSIRNDSNGLQVLRWWRKRCLEWCYNEFQMGKYADQCYLDEWPQQFDRVAELQNIGAGLGPWNHEQHIFDKDKNGIIRVDRNRLVFYHYHQLDIVTPAIIVPFINYPISNQLFKICYLPYMYALKKAMEKVFATQPNYAYGLSNRLDACRCSVFALKGISIEKQLDGPYACSELDAEWVCYCPGRNKS